MMTPPARHVTGGVDTHGDVHVAAVLDSATARHLGTESFPTTTTGYAALLGWLQGFGEVDRVGVESTGSYGAGLMRFLRVEAIEVIEVDRPDRKARRFEGKSDPIDAEAAARSVLSGKAKSVPKSRDGLVEAIRSLEVVHHGAIKDRTRAINQFKATLVSAPEAVRDGLRGLSLGDQLARAQRWPDGHGEPVEREVRWALKELARRIGFLDEQTARLETRIGELAAAVSPALMGLCGVGPHVAAQLLAAAGDNPDRMRSEAALAKLCGACPIPASSGKTTRHRLNRGGDRRANNALFTMVLVRMRHDPATRAYVARRRAEGKTGKEIMRCLKRFVAREVFQALTNPPADLPTGHELRQLRLQLGLSLAAVCNAVGTTPTRLSNIERGHVHDTRLARRARSWLLQNAA
ncbi:MAG TPA: IS110 family transposase [Acidimicrobiales bacterium]|jgi:transposase